MANEAMVANMTVQAGAASANTFIKVTDLLQILLKEQMDNELAKWVADGHSTCKEPIVMPNKELARSLEISMLTGDIPFMRLMYDKEGNLIEPKDLVGKGNLSEMTKEEFDKLGDFEVMYVVKDVDEEKVFSLAMGLERDSIIDKGEYILKPEQLNKFFGSRDTNTIKGLTESEAKVLQKEMADQKIHTALLRDEITKTFALELANTDLQNRVTATQMTPVERAMTKSLFKLSVPEMKEFEELKAENRKSMSSLTRDIRDSVYQKEPMPENIIYNAGNPERYIKLTAGGYAEVHEFGKCDKTINLRSDGGLKELKDQIDKYTFPQIMKTEPFENALERNPKALEAAYERYRNYQEMELNVDNVAEQLIGKHFMETKINKHDEKNPLAPFSFGAKEFRLENTSEVRELVGKLKPTSMSPEMYEKDGIMTDEIFKDSLDKLVENSDELMSKLDITPTNVHTPLAVRFVDLDFDTPVDYDIKDTGEAIASANSMSYYTSLDPTEPLDLSNCEMINTDNGIMFVDKDNPDRVVVSYDNSTLENAEFEEPNYEEADRGIEALHKTDEADAALEEWEQENGFGDDLGEDWM